jgi:hypothetical protein
MKKKPTQTCMTNRLDAIWREIIKLKGKCDKCGNTKDCCQLQAAHIYSRNNRATRWVIINGLALCAKDHRWAHQNPTEFADFVINKLGFDVYQDLKKLAHSIVHYSVDDKLEIEKQLQSVLNDNRLV